MSEIVKWIIVADLAVSALIMINRVGKLRVTTGPEAACGVVEMALIIVAVLVFWS